MQDRCVHGGGTLGPTVAIKSQVAVKPEKLKNVAVEDAFSKRVSNLPWNVADPKKLMQPITPLQSDQLSLPEGRVHGGSLMAFLSANAAGSSQPRGYAEDSTSMYRWV